MALRKIDSDAFETVESTMSSFNSRMTSSADITLSSNGAFHYDGNAQRLAHLPGAWVPEDWQIAYKL